MMKSLKILPLVVVAILICNGIEAQSTSEFQLKGVGGIEHVLSESFETSTFRKPWALNGCIKTVETGRWFKFTASSNALSVVIESDGKAGSLKYPQIYVGQVRKVRDNEKLFQIDCVEFDQKDHASLVTTKLKKGEEYYLYIAAKNEAGSGRFKITTSDKLSPDFAEGAEEIEHDYCSPEALLSTEGMTGDGGQTACYQGPLHNRWFKFTAESANLNAEVKYGGAMGSLKSAAATLWVMKDKEMVLLGCESKVNEPVGSNGYASTTLTYDKLVTGTEYYIAVDNPDGAEHSGTFTLCLSPNSGSGESIRGRIGRKDGSAVKNAEVRLVNQAKKLLSTTRTDEMGTFTFHTLPKEPVFISLIEEQDTELQVDIYLFAEDGFPSQRAIDMGDGTYGFTDTEVETKELVVIKRADYQLNVDEGMLGVTGRVVDKLTLSKGHAGVDIGLYSADRKRVAQTTTDKNGRFVFMNQKPVDYLVKMENPSEGDYSEIVIVDDLNVPIAVTNSRFMGDDGFFKFRKLPKEYVEMRRMEEKDTRMKVPTDFTKMEKGRPIVIRNIYFEPNSFELLPASFPELDRFAEVLKERSGVRVEISGHTDNTGNVSTNLKLSQKRADAVKIYLTRKGIDASRMVSKGYGQTRQVADNATEAGRQQNRRVEFVVL